VNSTIKVAAVIVEELNRTKESSDTNKEGSSLTTYRSKIRRVLE
jgi:hypothetical protein